MFECGLNGYSWYSLAILATATIAAPTELKMIAEVVIQAGKVRPADSAAVKIEPPNAPMMNPILLSFFQNGGVGLSMRASILAAVSLS
jgi:hypothetical protein